MRISSRDTEAIDGSASPRKPKVRMAVRSPSGIFEVAWRSTESAEIRFVHAAPVVGDADEPPPARLDRDLDASCARVERVLDELLDRRSRPLDHLARGDAVDKQRFESANRHGRAGPRRGLSHWSDGKWRRFDAGFTERVSVFAAFARASRASRGYAARI